MSKKKKWTLIALGTTLIVGAGSLLTLNATLSRIEPVIRDQAIQYLRRRFDAEVELAALHVQIPATPHLRLWLARGRGVLAMVSGEGVVVRRKSHPDEPPILALRTFSFQVDVGRIFNPRKEVALVTLEDSRFTFRRRMSGPRSLRPLTTETPALELSSTKSKPPTHYW